MSQTKRVWMSARPLCESGGGGFLGVGFVDVLPALQVIRSVIYPLEHSSCQEQNVHTGSFRSQILIVGAALATATLIAEHAMHFYRLQKVWPIIRNSKLHYNCTRSLRFLLHVCLLSISFSAFPTAPAPRERCGTKKIVTHSHLFIYLNNWLTTYFIYLYNISLD